VGGPATAAKHDPRAPAPPAARPAGHVRRPGPAADPLAGRPRPEQCRAVPYGGGALGVGRTDRLPADDLPGFTGLVIGSSYRLVVENRFTVDESWPERDPISAAAVSPTRPSWGLIMSGRRHRHEIGPAF